MACYNRYNCCNRYTRYRRLVDAGAPREVPTRFYYQYPPTLRLQPGPSERHVRPHCDSEYGHQPGELNFWMPLTDVALNRTTLWVEAAEGSGDFQPFQLTHGSIGTFHGSVLRHYVPANSSGFTRVSLDFRVGIEGHFDPAWQLRGTKEDHGRREATL